MFDLFDDTYARADVFHATSFAYINTTVNKDLQRFVDYYQSQPRFVNNAHLLVRLIMGLAVNFERPIDEIVRRTNDVMYQSCNPLGITTATNYGRVFTPGQFYNRTNEEIIFVHGTEFDVDMCYANWRTLQPVKVMAHPFTDMQMQRCGGRYISSETGLVVISINLPMLALQYKAWLDERERTGSHLRIHHFISMFVITNMVYSHTDLAYINRFKARYMKEPVQPYRRMHPFYITDVSQMLDAAIAQNIQSINKQSLSWDDIAWNFTLFGTYSLASFMRPPDVVPTRQILWAVTVGYLPLWDFLCRVTVRNKNASTFYTAGIKRYLRAIQNDRLLDRQLPQRTQNAINDHILNGITPAL